MTNEELRAWALARYGSDAIAGNLALVRALYEDARTVEENGQFPAESQQNVDRAELSGRLRRAGLSPNGLPLR